MLRLGLDYIWLGPVYKRLGELYEQKGDRANAADYYGRLVDLWKGGDPEFQPVVREARAGLKRVLAEPRRELSRSSRDPSHAADPGRVRGGSSRCPWLTSCPR